MKVFNLDQCVQVQLFKLKEDIGRFNITNSRFSLWGKKEKCIRDIEILSNYEKIRIEDFNKLRSPRYYYDNKTNKVYKNPHITFYFSDESVHVKYFKTNDEMMDFYKKNIQNNIPNRIVEND